MAAIETPLLSQLDPSASAPMTSRDDASLGTSDLQPPSYTGGAPPTYAAFSPVTLSASAPSRSSRQSTVLVHQKSPLLLATPPQITRALAYSHPFLLPLNTFVGLLTWSTGDPWQSFLLLSAFWAVVLYGDALVKTAGPVVVGAGLIAGMYGRRYSPLSSSGYREPSRSGKEAASKGSSGGDDADAPRASKGRGAVNDKQAKHRRVASEVTNTKHQKTLDEIVDTLKELTGRCNTLLDPLLEMTDFLSTQRTPTSATTKPALTAMFVRLLIITPFWIALTMPPLRVITTRRVVLITGTIILTWHARVMRVSRAILWRSAAVRRLAAATTGLDFGSSSKGSREAAKTHGTVSGSVAEKGAQNVSNLQLAHRRSGSSKSAGVKFTFIIYENQRRWVALGWTMSLFAYERAAWTDEHNNTVPPKDEFELPAVEDGSRMRWRWAEGSRWRVDGVPDEHGAVEYDGDEGKNGWIYYDNKWQNGRRGQDGWGKWTRRRKWYRDAELVEVEDAEAAHELDGADALVSTVVHTRSYSTANEKMISPMRAEAAMPLIDEPNPDDASAKAADDDASILSTSSKSSFWPASLRRRATDRSSIDKERKSKGKDNHKEKESDKNAVDVKSDATNDEDSGGLGIDLELELQKQGKEGGRWGIGDEARMSLE